MKNLILFTLLSLTSSLSYSQLVLEKTFADGELVVGAHADYDIDSHTDHLITFDEKKKALNIYNGDLKLYKSLTKVLEGEDKSCTPTYLSRHLFNADDKLEFLAYLTNKKGITTIKIINENGEVLENLGTASSAYCIKLKNEIKLLVNSYEPIYNSINPEIKYTSRIYALPGK